MRQGNESIEKTKKGLLGEFEKYLDEIFKQKKLTFDEIEKLVDNKMDTARTDIIQRVLEKEEAERSQEGIEPEETSLCFCGQNAAICRDEEGKIKIFERGIQTKRGSIKLKENGYYCTKCRKVFFPSKERVKTSKREL